VRWEVACKHQRYRQAGHICSARAQDAQAVNLRRPLPRPAGLPSAPPRLKPPPLRSRLTPRLLPPDSTATRLPRPARAGAKRGQQQGHHGCLRAHRCRLRRSRVPLPPSAALCSSISLCSLSLRLALRQGKKTRPKRPRHRFPVANGLHSYDVWAHEPIGIWRAHDTVGLWRADSIQPSADRH